MNEIFYWLGWVVMAMMLVAVLVAGWEHLVREARGRPLNGGAHAKRSRSAAVDVPLDMVSAALLPEPQSLAPSATAVGHAPARAAATATATATAVGIGIGISANTEAITGSRTGSRTGADTGANTRFNTRADTGADIGANKDTETGIKTGAIPEHAARLAAMTQALARAAAAGRATQDGGRWMDTTPGVVGLSQPVLIGRETRGRENSAEGSGARTSETGPGQTG